MDPDTKAVPALSVAIESDEELFEDEPIEYIRRDLEGSDSETRRRAATELVRGLLDQYPTEVTAIISNYIQHYLQRYNANIVQNWKDKDAALFLLTSIAAKSVGSQVSRHCCTFFTFGMRR